MWRKQEMKFWDSSRSSRKTTEVIERKDAKDTKEKPQIITYVFPHRRGYHNSNTAKGQNPPNTTAGDRDTSKCWGQSWKLRDEKRGHTDKRMRRLWFSQHSSKFPTWISNLPEMRRCSLWSDLVVTSAAKCISNVSTHLYIFRETSIWVLYPFFNIKQIFWILNLYKIHYFQV